jgi:hypothetical protein
MLFVMTTTNRRLGNEMAGTEAETPWQWWASLRGLYNFGLIVAGVVAFVCYMIVMGWIGDNVRGPNGQKPEIEITLFTTMFQGCGYLFMMGIANLCYYLGPICEILVKPRNVNRYRAITFHLGLWFSVALPFLVPATLVLGAVFHPEHFLRYSEFWGMA